MSESPLDAYRGQVALVTGARGFIGRHVTTLLATMGADVHAIVRPGGVIEPVAGVTYLESDLGAPETTCQAVRRLRPAITFNLAGYGIDPSERDPRGAASINAALVAELAVCCGRHANPRWDRQHLIHAGSALEYGTATGDLRESTDPQPTTLYGQTKLDGTVALTAAAADGAVRGITARLFTVYGPGELPTRLLPSLIATARTSIPLDLTAGTQRRDFTYVGDVAEGLLRLGLLREGSPVVNLATGTLESVRGFAERAADVIGLPRSLLRFGVLPSRPEEMHHANVSVATLQRLTGWTPSTSIEDGVRATVDADRVDAAR